MTPTPAAGTVRANDRTRRSSGRELPGLSRLVSGAVATALFIAGSSMLPGCSDPGSGGSGVPGAAQAPIADPRLIEGTIEALDTTSLTVNAVRIDITRAAIVRADGSAATTADLRVGLPVSITLTAAGATTAERIVIR